MLFVLNKKTAKKTQRKKRISGRGAFLLVWLRRFGVYAAIGCFALWMGAWAWLSGSVHRTADWATEQTLSITRDAGFSVQNIMVEGRKNADPSVLLGLMNIGKGDPLFAFSPSEATRLLEQVSWVDTVRIERRLPDTIYVDLKERVPLALFHDGKRLLLLDQMGESITDHDLGRFQKMVVVSGEGAAQNAPDLMRFLSAEPQISALAESALRIGQRRWDIKFKGGVVVNLPEDDMGLALRRLSAAQEVDAILDKNIKAIDLREPDRIIVRTNPGAVQEYKVNFNYGASKGAGPI